MSDSNEVVWQIFVPVPGGFVCLGGENCYELMEMALVQAFDDLEKAKRGFLCSFNRSDFDSPTSFKTLSSHKLVVTGIGEDAEVQPGRDEGSMIINLVLKDEPYLP